MNQYGWIRRQRRMSIRDRYMVGYIEGWREGGHKKVSQPLVINYGCEAGSGADFDCFV